ncbi:hypothetical protein JF546_19065 [Nitratireductor aquimarinus]|uniref:hypothetical protein n=1 Tax=Nitratireductor TaxID=245876 RepID=UPI001A8D8E0C|nr:MULTISPECIES: hypothetical protein [Nitratireductor]MBN8245123.1 hypothetical protein [Nitratireductor aquimarinus]MBY6133508.1 hypothetical protein [Nitratireductor aquimarinus]MCA1304841.1 hypothetical protein [Nitratireductor aquimarinus]MCV0350221.1 hypothetical protein [Nitratireductor sp.]
MKNWRNGFDDVGPPLHHDDLRPCFTKIGFGGIAVMIVPGPQMIPAPSSYQEQSDDPNKR